MFQLMAMYLGLYRSNKLDSVSLKKKTLIWVGKKGIDLRGVGRMLVNMIQICWMILSKND